VLCRHRRNYYYCYFIERKSPVFIILFQLFYRRKSPIFIILYIFIVVRYVVVADQSALHQLVSFFLFIYLFYYCFKNKLNSNRVTNNFVQLFSYLSFSLIYSNTHNTKYTHTPPHHVACQICAVNPTILTKLHIDYSRSVVKLHLVHAFITGDRCARNIILRYRPQQLGIL
jgi:multisubunit Na+/H+ antiporter MnhE subunit